MIRTCVLSFVLAVWFLTAFVDDVAHGQEAAAPPAASTFDLQFPGGTVNAFVIAVRRAAADVNIVMEPLAQGVPVTPVDLRRVTPMAALGILEDLQHHTEQGTVELGIKMIRGEPESRPIWKIRARYAGRSPFGSDAPLVSRVWSIKSTLDAGVAADDVLTAIDVALALYEDTVPAARLRFHAETGLLLARAHPAQAETIEHVIGELHDSMVSEARESVEAIEREAGVIIERLERDRDRLAEQARGAIEWQTRAELYRERLDMMQGELRDARAELQTAIRAGNDVVADLRARIAELERERAGGER